MMIEPWTTTVSSWQSLTFRSHSGNFLQATGYIRTVQRRCILQVSHWRSSIPIHMLCILHTYIRSALSMHHTDTCYQFCSLASQIQPNSAVWLFGVWLVQFGSPVQLRSFTTTIRHTPLHFKVVGTSSWIKLPCHKLACITLLTEKLPDFYNNQLLAFSYSSAQH